MDRPLVKLSPAGGATAVRLASGGTEATFLPAVGMLGTSLRRGDQEFLAMPGGLAAYRARHATGLPLLAPWANRLGAWGYRAAGVDVDLEGPDLPTDGNGLPIHGTMLAEPRWEIVRIAANGQDASLVDRRGIPADGSVQEPEESDPIGSRTFDDLYELSPDRLVELRHGSAAISLALDEKYPFLQVFVPPGRRFVCLEPMTAPVDALRSGRCPLVRPGDEFEARFSASIGSPAQRTEPAP
jgi:galactose mutarotase-like enzyme